MCSFLGCCHLMTRPAVLQKGVNMDNFNLDSINVFAKVSRQRDIMGRIKYVINQGEKFICSAGNQDMDYWRRLALECDRATRNSSKHKGTHAREVILYIPNDFLELTKKNSRKYWKILLFL